MTDLAKCGSPDCDGCYEVEPGVNLHPPKTSQEWRSWRRHWDEEAAKKLFEEAKNKKHGGRKRA